MGTSCEGRVGAQARLTSLAQGWEILPDLDGCPSFGTLLKDAHGFINAGMKNTARVTGCKMKVERSSGTIISIPSDHHKIDALFYHIVTHREHLENKPVLLRLHGILGNLLDETEHFLPSLLAARGYSSLSMNTLLANLGVLFGFGIFDESLQQIDKAFEYLRDLGFKKIVIAGHGLGGCMAVRYAAMRSEPSSIPELQGVVVIATPYSLSETVRRRWDRFGSLPSYDEVYQRARKVMKPEPGEAPEPDEPFLVKRAHGPTTRPEHTEVYTYRTWWDLASPAAEGTRVHEHIERIKVPILLVHGLDDCIVENNETEDLGRIARESGNPDVTEVYLQADHTFEGRHGELAEILLNWLGERF
jgi:pimeloyl-ACP methyl ester carboxylesterase